MAEAMRAVRLYVMALLAAGHRLRHDLARELVVLVCSLLLLATFVYVFNDFLNVQVTALSGAMRARFAEVARVALLLVTLGAGARLVRDELHGAASVRRMARRMGEARGVEAAYVVAKVITVLAVLHGAAWWAAARWLGPLPAGLAAAAGVEGVLIVLTVGLGVRAPREGAGTSTSTSSGTSSGTGTGTGTGTALGTLVSWRMRQLLFRNRTTRLCLALSVPFLGLAALAAARGAPPFVPAVCAFAAGYLAALAPVFQAAEDLRYAWLERGLGVSHAAFVAAYERLSWQLAAALAALAALAVAAGALAGGHTVLGDTPLAAAALKAALVGAVPLVVTPWLLLQIDGRRPAIPALTTLIVALFIGTAALAHWLGALLLLLLRHFAAQTQDKRFYRA